MNALKISIVTPSFNQGQFIELAIRSVLAQRYPKCEHIVVDNCSADETMNVVARYPHVTFISEPDRGQSDALNKGFRRASGDIVGWLNADEIYLPGVFHRIAEAFKRFPSLDVLYGDTMYWFPEHNRIGRRRAFPFSPTLLKFWGSYFNTCSTFFGRRFIEEGQFIEETYHYHMDHEFVLRLAERGYHFQYIPEVFSVFRVHGEGKTSSERTIELRRQERSRIRAHYSALTMPAALRCVGLPLLEWMYSATFGVVRKLVFLGSVRPAEEWLRHHAWNISIQ
jgi:glycosyltransferase involved in cell wall biosynthesis